MKFTTHVYAPNGAGYAVYTVIQFGYKPATNSTMLTVEPQATQITQLTKHQNNYNMKQNRTENMCICFKAEASALGLKASSQIRRLFLHHRLQTILR